MNTHAAPRVDVMGLALDRVSEAEAVDRAVSGLREGRGGWICPANLDVLRQSVQAPEVHSLVEQADLVVVGAGIAGLTTALLAARDEGVRRVVFSSSTSVYGSSREMPTTEASPPDPISPYGVAKLAAERYCISFSRVYESFETVVLRYFNVFGPRQTPFSQYAAVVPLFVTAINERRPVTIFGDGEQIRCFTWIGDVARAIADYSLDSRTDGEIFNLGNPVPVTMKELALKIHLAALRSGTLKDCRPLMFEHLATHEDDVRIRIPSIEKARRILGWEPTVTLEEALERCVAHASALYRTQ